MIKAGIIGATGYAGNEIVRLLLGHKDVDHDCYHQCQLSSENMSRIFFLICFHNNSLL